MKFLMTATTIVAVLFTLSLNEAKAGVSISVGEPGFYGRIDIGNYPPPRLIYGEPVIVRPVRTWYPPIYLRVPPGHVKHWYKHCDAYGACGRPVYFVEDDWYRDVYVPRYREYRGHVVAPAGPPVIHKPTYYEYRKYDHKPPRKVYIRDEYYRDDDHRRYKGKDKDRRYRDDHRRGHR